MKHRSEQQRDRLAAHVFVCTTDREDHDCCAGAGGAAVTAAIKEWLRDRDAFWTAVSVSTTDCVGLCSADGAALTIQPRNEWYSDVRPEEVPELLAAEFGPAADQICPDSKSSPED